MIPDPNDEILSIKRRLAAQFDNDLHLIAEEIRRRQRQSGRKVVSLAPRRCTPTDTTNTAMRRSGNKRVKNG